VPLSGCLEPARCAARQDQSRPLVWGDFKQKPPKASKYGASTASGFRDPELGKLIPKNLTATGTGEECVISKTKKGPVLGTSFQVEIGLDPARIAVKPYMWQEKSWRMPWTTDTAAAEKKCKAEAVKACTTHYAKEKKVQTAQLAKQCKQQQKACQAFFAGPEVAGGTWTLPVGNAEVVAHSAKECTTKILPGCKKQPLDLGSFQVTMAGATITANAPAECDKEFQQACVDTLIPAASAALLKHEQGHFDITNVRAERAQDALRELAAGFDTDVTVCAKGKTAKQQKAGKAKAVAKAKATLKQELKQLQKAYDEQRAQLRATQKQYDKETKHGIIEEKQAKWLQTIEEGSL
jgi:hypothetical protein